MGTLDPQPVPVGRPIHLPSAGIRDDRGQAPMPRTHRIERTYPGNGNTPSESQRPCCHQPDPESRKGGWTGTDDDPLEVRPLGSRLVHRVVDHGGKTLGVSAWGILRYGGEDEVISDDCYGDGRRGVKGKFHVVSLGKVLMSTKEGIEVDTLPSGSRRRDRRLSDAGVWLLVQGFTPSTNEGHGQVGVG